MSQQNVSDDTSLPIIHFLNKSDKTNSTSNQNNRSELPSVDNTTTELSTTDDNASKQTSDDGKRITTASHSRRVHFPTDDSQLRMISYPPEPLSNRPLLSLGVTLQRYRGSCQRLQIRPLNALLDQLNTMDDGRKSFYDRLDCLKVVNEKFDIKQIEALEEILSRCRFHTLDFDSSTMDDPALAQLFEIIEYYESCTHLNLSNNRTIGYQGYQALAKYLRKTSCLERLDMNSIRFDENSIISFTRSLRLSSTLYELHVESCQLNGKILQKFIENLRSCITLRELYLCDNRIQVQDSLYINNLIRTCGQFLYLLDLRSNSLQDGGMSHLASQFSQYDEHHTHESTLHKISFQANQLTQQGVGFLAKALLHNRTIHSLNLSNNNITNEGLFLLRDALLTNRTINELILRNCRLTDQAAIALAEFIAESSTIQYIDLRENTIQASGICGMAIAIKNNKSLLKLDFDPIVSTPTYLSSLPNNNNNIDRTSNNLLSLTNLRRMTTGLGSFTSSTPFQTTISGGGGTRELLEQKARWMNDIAAVCQRNILIYEENLRLQQEEEEQRKNQPTNGIDKTNQQNSTIAKPEDVELNEQTSNTNPSDKFNQDNNEEILQSNDDSVESNKENEQSLNIPINDNNQAEQVMNTPTNDNHDAQQSTAISTEHNDEVKQSEDNLINSDSNLEQTTNSSVEFGLNDNTEDQSDPNINDESSTFPESPSQSDLTDDITEDDKRKLQHSDSLYLIRKKVKNEDNDDTSDDESQLSSINEQMVDNS